MRGHVVKRGKDSYPIKISMGRDAVTGKYRYQWVTVRGNKTDAEKRLAELLHQLDTGTFMKPGKTTLGEFLLHWIKDYQPNLSPRGWERYDGIIKKHLVPSLGNIVLTQLRPEHIQGHYTAKLRHGLSPKTVNYLHNVLHLALKTAVKWGLLYRNPADVVDPPRFRRRDMQTWDSDEISRFLAIAKNSLYYELYYLALFTGMRRSELLALRWQDVDLIYCQLYCNRGVHRLKDGTYIFTEPKSEKSRRTIALSPSASLLLRDYREKKELQWRKLGIPLSDSDLVFCHFDGKPLRPNTVTHA